MDPKRFDDLTRALANGISRRQALKLFAVMAVGGLLGLDRIGHASAACIADGYTCSSEADCCNPGCCDPCEGYTSPKFCTGTCLGSGTLCAGSPCTSNSDCCSGVCATWLVGGDNVWWGAAVVAVAVVPVTANAPLGKNAVPVAVPIPRPIPTTVGPVETSAPLVNPV